MVISRRTHALESVFSSQSIDTPSPFLFPPLLLEALEFYLRFWKKNTFYKNCTPQCSLYKYPSSLKYINPNPGFYSWEHWKGRGGGGELEKKFGAPLSPPITLSSTQGALENFDGRFPRERTWVLKLQAIFMIRMGVFNFRM